VDLSRDFLDSLREHGVLVPLTAVRGDDGLSESFAAQGYRVLDERPAWRDTDCVELRWLRTQDGQQVTEEAISNPAHWAVWLDEVVIYVDRQSGEPVDEDSIDFYTEHHPEQQSEEGLRHFSTVIEKAPYAPVWFCIDYQGAGLDLEAVVHGEGQADDATRIRTRVARVAKPKPPKQPSASAVGCWPSTSWAMRRWVCAASS
jgi:hypothetical protein